uniref:FimV/HubP family polar landmark protein n=1 Tax=Alteromonas lipotrueiana TaxID=2803815 RepID=UPI002484AC47
MKLHLSGLFLLLCLSVFIAPDTNAQERQTQLRGPKNATSQFSGAVYGPIDEQDTLWRIAKQYRQDDSLSMYQVMQAIYELNPNAFEQQNRNLLVEGATLRLPSRRYISRINTDQARGNAETDNTRYSQLIDQPSTPGNNIKSPEPLAKQSELSDTRTAIEQKITKLDEQQIQQFDELRQQFAASLDNVQQMLNENRKLYERVEQVNTDLLSLKQQVEGDVQSQMDEQLALQRELLAMVKQDQSAREAEQQSSFGSALTQPISLIIGSGILTLLLAGGLAAWLLRARNNGQTDSPSAPQAEAPLSSSDNMSSSVSHDFDDDTPELTDSELFDDDELLDDVLSSELEDTLDAELDSFADDMLVPDDNDHIFDEGDTELGQDDLDSLFDDEIMDTVELTEDADNIAVSGVEDTDLEDTGLEELDPEKTDHEEAEFDSESDTLPEESPVSEEDFAVNTKDAGALNDPAPDETDNPVSIAPAAHNGDEQPEISIDELLEAEQAKTQNSFVTNNDVVDDEMLGKLDSEINQQNAELDRLADGILQEIDQIEQMGGLPTAEEIEQEKFESRSGSAQGIQNLDSFAEELDDIELNDIDNADNFADPLSDELIAQLQAENEDDEDSSYLSEPEDTSVAGFDDPLSNELLAELSADQGDSEEQLDTLSDELLAELEGNPTSQEPGDIEALPAQDTDPLESDELTDDLLAELEAGISAESDFADSDDVSNTDNTASDTGKDTNDIDALLDSVAEANDDEDKSVPQSDNDLAPDIEPPNVDANSDVENAESDVENTEKDADSDANV